MPKLQILLHVRWIWPIYKYEVITSEFQVIERIEIFTFDRWLCRIFYIYSII